VGNIIIGIITGAVVGFITKSVTFTLLVGIGLMIICTVGSRLINPQKYVLNNMIREARKTTSKVLEKVNQQCFDKNILKKCYSEIIGINLTNIPEKYEYELDNYLTCIEGLCYLIGLNHSKFPTNSMVFRCIQFITLIDKSLYGYGIKPCSLEKKVNLYKIANLYEVYIKDPKSFFTSENKAEELYQNKNEEPMKNENSQSDKKISIMARNKFPPSELNLINIYNELINSKKLSFEIIWDKFQNIQCLNDIILYENIEYISNGGYSANVKHFIDSNGNDCIMHFSCLPDKSIDFLLFQLILEYYKGIFYYKQLVTNIEEIKDYKEILKNEKPSLYHTFLYGPYPYYYEKNNVSYVQVFTKDISGEVLFEDICVLSGKYYEVKNYVIIKGHTILF